MFEDASTTARMFANTVSKKAQEVIEYSKKKFSIMELENELDINYNRLGRFCYDKLFDELAQREDSQELIDTISKLEQDVKARKEEMNCAATDNVCSECGNQNSEQAAFCSACGHKL